MPTSRLPNTPTWPAPTTRRPARSNPGRQGAARFEAGTVLTIGADASVQFALAPFLFRVIRVHDWSTSHGWVWLDGYELNQAGDAVERRSIYVQVDGVKPAAVRPTSGLRLVSSAKTQAAGGGKPQP